MTANLVSPHTVALYDFGVAADGTFFYVMELLDGIDLRQLVEDTSRFNGYKAFNKDGFAEGLSY